MRQLRRFLPISSRCYEKPCGLGADPVAIEWICGFGSPNEANGTLLEWEKSLSFAQSIRARREFVAKELDDSFRAAGQPRVLSVNNGHIREAQDALPLLRMSGGEFVAFDAHRESLQFVEKTFGRHGVQSIQGGFADLQASDNGLGSFDFIYSLSRLDQLKPSSARVFLASLAAMLKPGGRLLVGNFTPEMQDSAYLEAVMNWWPVYRTEEEIADLTDGISDEVMTGHVVFRDRPGNIVFLEVQR